ncbi:MAG: phage gp6-like head-tail connector protein [Bacteroidales bacterium]|nr:phage gp6-like head-tail connector protein [Bacteroidales bacterium]
MAVVSLELFKKHMRADEFADDDDNRTHVLGVAEESVIRFINRTAEVLVAIGDGSMPMSIVHAVMMPAAHWYNQRESVSPGQIHQVPDTLQALVKPFRKLVRYAGRSDEV